MTEEREALDMIAKLQMVEQTMEAACKRIDELKAENKALKEALAQPVSSHGNAEDLYLEMSKHLNCPHCGGSGHIDDVAQPEQEPVVVRDKDNVCYQYTYLPQHKQEPVAIQYASRAERDLYEMEDEDDTTPPQRKPLDIKEIKFIATYCGEHITDEDVIEITRRVEEAHGIKEKNT